MKLIDRSVMPLSRIDNECTVQSMLNHPYIMPLTGSFDWNEFRVMLMPRATGGSLFQFGMSPQHPVTIAKVIYRLFQSVKYLHSLDILHGDIKPGNVLLKTSDFTEPFPLLIDFGHAASLSGCETCHCHLMTCCYSSPELLALKGHSFPSDIWSLAATLYYVVTGRDLMRLDSLETMSRIAANLKLSFSGDAWQCYPESLKSLMDGMLRSDPEARLTIDQCLNHLFFTDMLDPDWIEKENESLERFLSPDFAQAKDVAVCQMSISNKVAEL
jgi:serine/threonine protein kinase